MLPAATAGEIKDATGLSYIGTAYRIRAPMDEDATEVEYEGWATNGRSMRRGRGASQDNEEEAWQRMLGQLLDA